MRLYKYSKSPLYINLKSVFFYFIFFHTKKSIKTDLTLSFTLNLFFCKYDMKIIIFYFKLCTHFFFFIVDKYQELTFKRENKDEYKRRSTIHDLNCSLVLIAVWESENYLRFFGITYSQIFFFIQEIIAEPN